MNLKKTGQFIARVRKERSLTQAQLGEMLHVSGKTVSKWETGRSFPDYTLVEELCGILGVTVDELIRGGEETSLLQGKSYEQDKESGNEISEEKKPENDENQSSLDRFQKEQSRYKRKHILIAAAIFIISLTLCIIIYKSNFDYDINSLSSLREELIDRLWIRDFPEYASEVKVLGMESLGNMYYVLFEPGLSQDGAGIAIIEKGIFGGFRFNGFIVNAWPLFDYIVTSYHGQHYLVFFGRNEVPQAAYYKIYMNDSGELLSDNRADKGQLLAEGSIPKIPSVTFIKAEFENNIQPNVSFGVIYYYDKNGIELDRYTLATSYDISLKYVPPTGDSRISEREWRGNKLSVSRLTADYHSGGLYYIQCGVVLLISLILLWHELKKILWNGDSLSGIIYRRMKAREESYSEDRQNRIRKIRIAVIIVVAAAAVATAVIANVIHNANEQKMLESSQTITDVFVYDGETYSLREIPYRKYYSFARHYAVQNEQSGMRTSLPSGPAYWSEDTEQIIYCKGNRLYSCDIDGKNLKEIFRSGEGNALWYLKIRGQYASFCSAEVKHSTQGDVLINTCEAYLIDMTDLSVTQMPLENTTLMNLLNVSEGYAWYWWCPVVTGSVSLADHDSDSFCKLYRYDLETGEEELVADHLQMNCTEQAYTCGGYLYFISESGRIYRISEGGGEPEEVQTASEAEGMNRAVSLFQNGGHIYAVLDNSTTYLEATGLAVVQITPVADLICTEEVPTDRKVIRYQNGLLVTAGWPVENDVKIIPVFR